MLPSLTGDLALFVIVVFGLGLPCAWAVPRWPPLERLCLAVAGALTVAGLGAFGLYVAGGARGWYWALPLAAAAIGAVGGRRTVRFFADHEIGRALGLWLLLALWCLGLQALVVNYSGGGWAGDWWEHYDRARFFLERWPRDTQFLGVYLLPARPPLANLVTGAFLALSDASFVHYQVFTTLLSTLVILPALVWLPRFGGRPRHAAGLLFLLMASPVLVQNATFPWTKLLAAFFVLAGLAWLHRSLSAGDDRRVAYAGWLTLAAGLLCHYSVGPWLVAAALAVLLARRTEWRRVAFWRELGGAALLGALLLTPWFGWSTRTYGWHGTVATNTAVTGAAGTTTAGQLGTIALNVVDTVVPHFLRDFDKSLIAQPDAAGALRDHFFNLYQINLVFAFGSAGGIILLYLLTRRRAEVGPIERVFWWTLLPTATVLGIAVHSPPDYWGVAHICLQPLVILGLVWLAARVSALPPVLRGLFAAGVAVDFLLGVALHFAIESLALERWLAPGHPAAYYAARLGLGGRLNFVAKQQLHAVFLGDRAARHALLVVGALGLLLGVVGALAWAAGRRPRPAE